MRVEQLEKQEYYLVNTIEELGQFARARRKKQNVTIELMSTFANLSPRFISEFERGKETAEVGKVLQALHMLGLEVIVAPRGTHERYR